MKLKDQHNSQWELPDDKEAPETASNLLSSKPYTLAKLTVKYLETINQEKLTQISKAVAMHWVKNYVLGINIREKIERIGKLNSEELDQIKTTLQNALGYALLGRVPEELKSKWNHNFTEQLQNVSAENSQNEAETAMEDSALYCAKFLNSLDTQKLEQFIIHVFERPENVLKKQIITVRQEVINDLNSSGFTELKNCIGSGIKNIHPIFSTGAIEELRNLIPNNAPLNHLANLGLFGPETQLSEVEFATNLQPQTIEGFDILTITSRTNKYIQDVILSIYKSISKSEYLNTSFPKDRSTNFKVQSFEIQESKTPRELIDTITEVFLSIAGTQINHQEESIIETGKLSIETIQKIATTLDKELFPSLKDFQINEIKADDKNIRDLIIMLTNYAPTSPFLTLLKNSSQKNKFYLPRVEEDHLTIGLFSDENNYHINFNVDIQNNSINIETFEHQKNRYYSTKGRTSESNHKTNCLIPHIQISYTESGAITQEQEHQTYKNLKQTVKHILEKTGDYWTTFKESHQINSQEKEEFLIHNILLGLYHLHHAFKQTGKNNVIEFFIELSKRFSLQEMFTENKINQETGANPLFENIFTPDKVNTTALPQNFKDALAIALSKVHRNLVSGKSLINQVKRPSTLEQTKTPLERLRIDHEALLSPGISDKKAMMLQEIFRTLLNDSTTEESAKNFLENYETIDGSNLRDLLKHSKLANNLLNLATKRQQIEMQAKSTDKEVKYQEIIQKIFNFFKNSDLAELQTILNDKNDSYNCYSDAIELFEKITLEELRRIDDFIRDIKEDLKKKDKEHLKNTIEELHTSAKKIIEIKVLLQTIIIDTDPETIEIDSSIEDSIANIQEVLIRAKGKPEKIDQYLAEALSKIESASQPKATPTVKINTNEFTEWKEKLSFIVHFKNILSETPDINQAIQFIENNPQTYKKILESLINKGSAAAYLKHLQTLGLLTKSRILRDIIKNTIQNYDMGSNSPNSYEYNGPVKPPTNKTDLSNLYYPNLKHGYGKPGEYAVNKDQLINIESILINMGVYQVVAENMGWQSKNDISEETRALATTFLTENPEYKAFVKTRLQHETFKENEKKTAEIKNQVIEELLSTLQKSTSSKKEKTQKSKY